MIRWSMLTVVMIMVGACSSAPPRVESRALGNQVSQSADRFIIVAVDSTPTAYVAHAGSTPHGYDAVADYGPTSRARRAMRALENEYGLREVNAWPIEPLHIHCAVLRIPSAADRSTLLAAVANDQ